MKNMWTFTCLPSTRQPVRGRSSAPHGNLAQDGKSARLKSGRSQVRPLWLPRPELREPLPLTREANLRTRYAGGRVASERSVRAGARSCEP